MNAWAISQVEHLTPLEIAAAVVIGMLLLWLILKAFPRRARPEEHQASIRTQPGDGALGSAIAAAQAAIIRLAREKVPSAGAFHIGAVDISPANLAFWITTPTDAERDRLKADEDLRRAFRAALADAGYPPDSISHVGFAYESQETCDRDYGGNWWYVIK
ncbi:MAG: hypothetical protein K1X35_10225 [Caulobacteraceae bacterium]|nr:hypothetical protein [Caulobacteraceae bacterium]